MSTITRKRGRPHPVRSPFTDGTRKRVWCVTAALIWLAAALAPAAYAQTAVPAPATILLFSDFQCPYCARVGAVLLEAERRFPGRIQVVFKHMPLPIHPQAPLAHEAALEAAAQGRFQQMHDLLFANQAKLDAKSLVEHAAKAGLDTVAFERALGDRRHKATLARDLREAQALGVNATPTLFVNGRRLVGVPSIEALSAAISGAPEETTAASAPVPVERISIAGAPAQGPADAPITIVEFSDLQCGFCARAAGTVRDVVRSYAGRVRWIFKHYPLDFHRDAMLAHEITLAAEEQGKFWEMHDAIFTSQHAMKRPDLLRLAGRLGLDVARLEKDVDSGRFKEIVDRDRREGAGLGVEGTPTFFINGYRLVGAQPAPSFKAIIDRELAKDASPTAGQEAPRVVLEWFSDLRNPLSRDAAAQVRQLRTQYGRQMTVVFRHRPLEGREESVRAHEAVLAADEQGKFWEMHDLLLVQQSIRSSEQLIEQAGRLGLDPVRFTSSLASGRFRTAIQSDLDEAKARDVRGTPVFFINGKRFDGVVPLGELRQTIDAVLSAAAVK
jgi:protein-disulfide isomerase